MSYDPTEWAPQNPGTPPAQPPVTPPAYGQAQQQPAQPPTPPAYGQAPQYPMPQPSAQPPIAPTVYSQPPQYPIQQPPYGQSSPSLPPYGQQAAQPSYGQSSPSLPPYGQQAAQPSYGQSSPSLPPYGQQAAQPSYGQSSPSLPPYGQSNPSLPPYGQQAAQPAYGQSSPSLPPYGQSNPSAPTYPPYGTPQPGDPYAQQPSWGAAVPPGFVPPAPAKKKGGAKFLIIALIVLLILGGGGYAVYHFATLPQPVISMTSTYHDGATLVGASSTTFKLTGSDFSSSEAVSFLLDNQPVPGAASMQSDSKGALTATLTVTDAWSVGSHTITAKDASGYLTKTGVKVEIVAPGQASTPGPNGAPTDSANIGIVAIVVAGSSSGTANLTVTGSANGGTVCRDLDDGKPHSHTGDANGVAFTETTIHTCSGTYKGGRLTYTETATSDKIAFANGLSCVAHVPYVSAHLEGAFTSSTAISGSYSEDVIVIDCNLGVGTQTTTANHGTWTGTAVVH